jgi:hypothetical protein
VTMLLAGHGGRLGSGRGTPSAGASPDSISVLQRAANVLLKAAPSRILRDDSCAAILFGPYRSRLDEHQ